MVQCMGTFRSVIVRYEMLEYRDREVVVTPESLGSLNWKDRTDACACVSVTRSINSWYCLVSRQLMFSTVSLSPKTSMKGLKRRT